MRDDDNLDPGRGPAQPPPEDAAPTSLPPEPTPPQSAGAPQSLWERIKKALGG